MIWDAAGAEAVAAVRAWLKRERWEEALALRDVRQRSYRRKQAARAGAQSATTRHAAQEPAHPQVEAHDRAQRSRLRADVLAPVQAELAEQRGKNGWGKAWSVKRQRELAVQRERASSSSRA